LPYLPNRAGALGAQCGYWLALAPYRGFSRSCTCNALYEAYLPARARGLKASGLNARHSGSTFRVFRYIEA
jgi:hypothetical protein